MNLAYEAMLFASEVHKHQKRRFTNAPYTTHLAEVAGIVATVSPTAYAIAVAWLHDCIEDQGVMFSALVERFGLTVANGVLMLSDTEKGNRAQRKAMTIARLSVADGWIQNIKCADVISNVTSIAQHDKEFAAVYVPECEALVSALTGASPVIRGFAANCVERASWLLE